MLCNVFGCAYVLAGGGEARGEELEVRRPECQHAHAHPVPAEVEESTQVRASLLTWWIAFSPGGRLRGVYFVVVLFVSFCFGVIYLEQ